MIPSLFEYYSPASLKDALSLLSTHVEDAKLLAGGQSLLPLMKLRLADPPVLIDLNPVEELAGIEERGDHLRIGAMTRHAALEASEVIRARYSLIAEAAPVIADPLVRTRGTTGGSLAHADPAGDLGSVMMALRAELMVTGPSGERTIPIDDFLLGPFTSSLEPVTDELVRTVLILGKRI